MVGVDERSEMSAGVALSCGGRQRRVSEGGSTSKHHTAGGHKQQSVPPTADGVMDAILTAWNVEFKKHVMPMLTMPAGLLVAAWMGVLPLSAARSPTSNDGRGECAGDGILD